MQHETQPTDHIAFAEAILGGNGLPECSEPFCLEIAKTHVLIELTRAVRELVQAQRHCHECGEGL